jgi:hypothetical protein
MAAIVDARYGDREVLHLDEIGKRKNESRPGTVTTTSGGYAKDVPSQTAATASAVTRRSRRRREC